MGKEIIGKLEGIFLPRKTAEGMEVVLTSACGAGLGHSSKSRQSYLMYLQLEGRCKKVNIYYKPSSSLSFRKSLGDGRI